MNFFDCQTEDGEPVIRKNRSSEPVTRRDYLKIMSSVTKREGNVLAILTSHWPHNGENSWFRDMHGELKWEKDKSKHPVIINSWIKKSKLTPK